MDFTKTTLGDVADTKIEVAVLPWGALEPHNFHLPYYTDCLLAQAVALEGVRKSGVKAALFPPIFLGQQNPTQYDFPLCIHARVETQKYILEDFVRSLHHQGIRKLLIVNGHGGNSFKGYVRDLMFAYPGFEIFVCDWWTLGRYEDFFEAKGEHADELETSVLMHYHPDLVDITRAGDGDAKPFAAQSLNQKYAWTPRNWKKTTADTGVGNPHKSSAEKGAKFANVATDKIAQLLREICL